MTIVSVAARTSGPPAAHPAEAANDVGLIRGSLAGDSRSFAEIVRAYHGRVYGFLYQMMRHRQDAEDLTQQTFIKAYHNLGRFDARRPLINWLLTIARNGAINHFRDTKRWSEMPEDVVGREPSPATTAERREDAENLWDRARALLSPREFEVLWLRFGEELSIGETAQVVGLTQTHVKVLVHRARQALLKGATI
jgi:RNA polymerase sigma-70 factor, ECF subfamily